MRFQNKNSLDDALIGATAPVSKPSKINPSNREYHITEQDRLDNVSFRLKWYRDRLPFATDPEELRRLRGWIAYYESGGI